MSDDTEKPKDGSTQSQKQQEEQHKRHLRRLALVESFFKAFAKGTEGFAWQLKAEMLELFMQYVQVLQTNPGSIDDFYTEKFMKPYKQQLRPLISAQLFKHFDQHIAYAELGIITTEEFNSLHPGYQGMTDSEYQLYLSELIRGLKTEQYFHYTYASDQEEKNEAESVAGNQITIKGRIAREAGDNLTKLTQEQTALLIEYLRRSKFLLNDEYLNDKQAGIAFNILTGYSPDSLRMKLGSKGIEQIKTKANLKELDNALTALKILIDKDIKASK